MRHSYRGSRFLSLACLWSVAAFTPPPAGAADVPPSPATPAAVVVEAEDFRPQNSAGAPGWKVVFNGQGNYMADIIGFNHISGERLLSGDALAKNARAVASVSIPEGGTYRVWSRFEQPTGTENRFRVEVRQQGKLVGAAVMGEKTAPKYFFGDKNPVGQYDAPWGSEGLVEQAFDIAGLTPGPAEITLVAIDQPQPAANRNVDFLFLTRDLKDSWRDNPEYAHLYPILDAALQALPTRYYVRLTSPVSVGLSLRYYWNRQSWYVDETSVDLAANVPGAWVPLRKQDVTHFTTLYLTGPVREGLKVKIEFASDPEGRHVLRTIDWDDPQSNKLHVSLPPYPGKYAGENIITAEEQYAAIRDYLSAHPSTVGREPTEPLAWGGWVAAWDRGRVGEMSSTVYHDLGMRSIATSDGTALDVVRERFKKWGQPLNRSVAIGAYRLAPTVENIAAAKKTAEDAGVLPYLQRFDYGDEIPMLEWLAPIKPDEMKARFVAWQKQGAGHAEFEAPDSGAGAATANPKLYVESQKFYEDTAISYVAAQAREIPKQLGPDVVYGANYALHPYYYPLIGQYIKWFRATPSGDYAATFGRHSEYFWEVGQPGPLVNGYVAEHFLAGMRYNPQSVLLQYNMPHSPGNSDASFRRSAFTHLAHGARGLDYFGIGVNYSFTENYIDFRDKARYAAIRDINRAMATVEDIIPTSRPVPSKVALILSDSTERWDIAGVATDKLGYTAGADYKKVRLAYHQERVGLYYALVHSSHPPDLVTEEDVQNGVLKDYAVAYWVGDCAELATIKSLDAWVKTGGRLVATAGAFRFDQYRRPTPEGLTFLGLQSAALEVKDTFFRPQIELPRLVPIDHVGSMPALAMRDGISVLPAVKTLASFQNGKPAIVQRANGKGRITYIATLPGVAYMWSAYQPPPVPSRGPSSHMALTKFDAATRNWITAEAKTALTNVDANGAWIDARLLQSPKGYAIPLANYSADTSKLVTLTIRGPKNIRAITSASRGPLKLQSTADGAVIIHYAPGLGDILRIN